MKSLFAALGVCLLCLTACGNGGGTGDGGDDDGGEPPRIPQDLRLDTDLLGAELSFVPQVCCDGNNVYVVWADRRAGLLDIYFNRSVDQGLTWLERDIRLNTDGDGLDNSQLPRICCAGQSVYVVWHDERNGLPDIYFNRSLDGGLTWLATDVRLDTDLVGTGASRDPRLCCDGSRVYAVWADQRAGDWDVYANSSSDGGVTWLRADVRVDVGGADDAEFPAIACVGDSVYAAWLDTRHGGSDVFTSRSSDRGQTWSRTDVRLNDGAPSPGFCQQVALALNGANVYALWSESRSGLADIRFNRSADSGATWLRNDVRIDTDRAGAGLSTLPSLCVAGSTIYVTWQDERDGAADVYFRRSLDGGATWPVDDFRLDTNAAGATSSFAPSICCDGASVGVAWYDARNGRMDIFLNWSPDSGRNWLTEDLRIDDDDPGTGHSITPVVCCRGDRVVVVWSDQRDGPGDVYARGADFSALPR